MTFCVFDRLDGSFEPFELLLFAECVFEEVAFEFGDRFSEHYFQFNQSAFEDVQPFVQALEYSRFDGAFAGEAAYVDLVGCLSQAVASPDALLDAHGVPRQVVVDDYMAVLEVEPFAGYFARQEHLEFAPAELCYYAFSALLAAFAVLVSGRCGTVHQLQGVATRGEFPPQIAQRSPEGREHHRPVRSEPTERVLDQFTQCFELAVRGTGHRFGQGPQDADFRGGEPGPVPVLF